MAAFISTPEEDFPFPGPVLNNLISSQKASPCSLFILSSLMVFVGGGQKHIKNDRRRISINNNINISLYAVVTGN